MLSHYKAIVWYTGDDIITREQGQPPGTASKLAADIQNAVRDFMNEGGKVFYSGKYAGYQHAFGYAYDPDQGSANGDGPCTDPASAFEGASERVHLPHGRLPPVLPGGVHLHRRGRHRLRQRGQRDRHLPVQGTANPFAPTQWQFGGSSAAQNIDHSASFLVTSSILDPALFPTYADSRKLAKYVRSGPAPYEPYTGAFFAASDANDASYKRMHREIDLTGKTSGELSFQISYDLEPDYDYVFVEAHTVGQDDWTTLPEKDGETSTDTGLSCPSTGDGSDWQSLHPFLAHYQTKSANGETCTPTGNIGNPPGAWNAATGNSGGWHKWEMDLSQYAGKKIEVSITVATDPAVLGLGVWVDDTVVTLDGSPVAQTSFEADMGGWAVGPPPAGTVSTANGWHRTGKEFEEGPVVGTTDSVYAGFGFEGISGAGNRATFMGRRCSTSASS